MCCWTSSWASFSLEYTFFRHSHVWSRERLLLCGHERKSHRGTSIMNRWVERNHSVCVLLNSRKRFLQSRSTLLSSADSGLRRSSFRLLQKASNKSHTCVTKDATSLGGCLHLGILPYLWGCGAIHSFEIVSAHWMWGKPHRMASIL
jgi:hypothetical protein